MILPPKNIRKLRRFGVITSDSLLEKGLLPGIHNYQKFIILCTARTGSNFLCSLLQSHIRIRAFAEVFHKDSKRKRIFWDYPGYNSEEFWEMRENNPIKFIDNIVFRDFPKSVSAVGFKLFYNHAQAENEKCIWEHLKQIKYLKIIHLKRQNWLQQYVSLTKARQSKQWVVKANNSNSKGDSLRLEIDYDNCIEHFQTLQNLQREYDNLFAGHQILEVIYENLAKDYINETKRIQNFLSVPYQKLYPSTYKQSQQPLSEIIINYSELKEKFQETPWIDYFEE